MSVNVDLERKKMIDVVREVQIELNEVLSSEDNLVCLVGFYKESTKATSYLYRSLDGGKYVFSTEELPSKSNIRPVFMKDNRDLVLQKASKSVLLKDLREYMIERLDYLIEVISEGEPIIQILKTAEKFSRFLDHTEFQYTAEKLLEAEYKSGLTKALERLEIDKTSLYHNSKQFKGNNYRFVYDHYNGQFVYKPLQ